MIKATVLTRYGHLAELQFDSLRSYIKWNRRWQENPNSIHLIHGWQQSIRQCDITRVISVEEEN